MGIWCTIDGTVNLKNSNHISIQKALDIAFGNSEKFSTIYRMDNNEIYSQYKIQATIEIDAADFFKKFNLFLDSLKTNRHDINTTLRWYK